MLLIWNLLNYSFNIPILEVFHFANWTFVALLAYAIAMFVYNMKILPSLIRYGTCDNILLAFLYYVALIEVIAITVIILECRIEKEKPPKPINKGHDTLSPYADTVAFLESVV